MGSILERAMLVRRDRVVHRLGNDALGKDAYDQLRCNDNGWVAKLFYLNRL